MQFCFELRKKDTDNAYTVDFLNGQVKPQIFVDIMKANIWNERKQSMEVNPKSYFRIHNQNNFL